METGIQATCIKKPATQQNLIESAHLLTHPASAGFLLGDKGSAPIAWICRQPGKLRASLGQPPSGCIPRRFLPDCLRGQALRAVPLSYPLADRLSGLHQHQGCGFARHPHPFGTRCAPFRVRPPVSPLTLIPANTRATTDNERGNETAKTRRPLVMAARWPGREAVTKIRLWRAGFSSASVRPAA